MVCAGTFSLVERRRSLLLTMLQASVPGERVFNIALRDYQIPGRRRRGPSLLLRSPSALGALYARVTAGF
jgi:hypothetical protein